MKIFIAQLKGSFEFNMKIFKCPYDINKFLTALRFWW